MAKHDSIPVSSSKLPLFAPFAVPKIGNMATAWHEILHLGTKQRHSAGSIVKVEGETCFDLFYIDEGKVHVVFDIRAVSVHDRRRDLANSGKSTA